jgi:hypothetical protein
MFTTLLNKNFCSINTFMLFLNQKLLFNNYIHATDLESMVFNATFNNISVISWQSILLVVDTRVPRENNSTTKEILLFNTFMNGLSQQKRWFDKYSQTCPCSHLY